jgi:hypothetical protein
MIAYIAPQSSGNAIRILLQPPLLAENWIVLRKSADDFTDANDLDAILVYTGSDRYIVDSTGLINGEEVFYHVYYFRGATLFSESTTKSVIPISNFIFQSVDVISIVRDRLDLGLQALVGRGILRHPRGLIPVLIASPMLEEASLPIVTVHLMSESAEVRGIGELSETEQAGEGDLLEGWFSRYQLEIISWSLNSDQRKMMRSSIKHIIAANFPVFDAFGFETIDLQFADNEDFQTYQMPMYMVNCTMRFLAPTALQIPGQIPVIDIQPLVSI